MFERFPRPAEIGDLEILPDEELMRRALASPESTGVHGFEIDSPLGRFGLAASAFGVAMVFLPGFDDDTIHDRFARFGRLAWASWGRQRAIQGGIELMGYLVGEVRRFETPVDVSYATPFQQSIFRTLQDVPFGETITYGELAREAGQKGKARAVGTVMRHNPCPIFVPCHRVLPASGALGGWSGPAGMKRALLEHEGVLPADDAVAN